MTIIDLKTALKRKRIVGGVYLNRIPKVLKEDNHIQVMLHQIYSKILFLLLKLT